MFPHWELEQARIVAKAIGTDLVEVDCDVLEVEKVVANGPDRCYHCKTAILGRIKDLAKERGLGQVVDGNNADDVETGRQGIKAVIETGTRSPLAEVGLTKGDVRDLAKLFGLPSADKPSSACLASRIPFGEQLTLKKLEQVERAEERLRALGIGQMRVRHHGRIARIEVGLMDISKVLLHREEIVHDLKEIGFTYVTLDLEGFRSGSLEESVLRSGIDRSMIGPSYMLDLVKLTSSIRTAGANVGISTSHHFTHLRSLPMALRLERMRGRLSLILSSFIDPAI